MDANKEYPMVSFCALISEKIHAKAESYLRFFLSGLIAFIIPAVVSAETGADSVWKLSITAPESDGVLAIQLGPAEHFHVVLENRSKTPKKIWKDSNSWGYSALSFEVTDRSGTKRVIRKRPRNWRKNFPGFWKIGHRKYLVYNVSLTNNEWEFVVPERSELRRLKMQAIIDVPDDDQARKFGVWTGRITSPVYEIDF